MGTTVTYELDDVIVPKDRRDACLKAINGLHDQAVREELYKKNRGGFLLPTRYRWVDDPGQDRPNGWRDLKEAFDEWGFETEEDGDTGDLLVTYFIREKLGDEDLLFETIAPFLNPGGTIFGEEHDEGGRWKFEFDGERVSELAGTTIYHTCQHVDKLIMDEREVASVRVALRLLLTNYDGAAAGFETVSDAKSRLTPQELEALDERLGSVFST